MNTHHSLARTNAPTVNRVIAALIAALAVALLTITATGERTQAQETNVLTIGPAEVGFGAVEIGTTAERTVTVKNNGDTTLDLNLLLLGLDPLDDFSVNIPGGGNILSLTPGEESTLNIEFAPTVGGTRVLELDFEAAGGGDGAPTVDVEGTGFDPDDPTDPNNPGPGVQANCSVIGTNGNDTLTGTDGRDTICGLDGNDKIDGRGDNDKMLGGNGNDRFNDDAGKDKSKGQKGKDRINTKDGEPRDRAVGGSGKDKVKKDKKDKSRSI